MRGRTWKHRYAVEFNHHATIRKRSHHACNCSCLLFVALFGATQVLPTQAVPTRSFTSLGQHACAQHISCSNCPVFRTAMRSCMQLYCASRSIYRGLHAASYCIGTDHTLYRALCIHAAAENLIHYRSLQTSIHAYIQ